MTASTHDLLLELAGRVDDDLLTWARELVAVGENTHAMELLAAAVLADSVTLPHWVRDALAAGARTARPDLDIGAALPPPDGEEPSHVFDPAAGPVEHIAEVLRELPARRLAGCAVHVTWRLTPAGSAPGPVPHPVVLVEVEPDRSTEVLAYQLATELERAGRPASVEVFPQGAELPAYHRAALRAAVPVDLTRSANTPSAGARVAPPPSDVGFQSGQDDLPPEMALADTAPGIKRIDATTAETTPADATPHTARRQAMPFRTAAFIDPDRSVHTIAPATEPPANASFGRGEPEPGEPSSPSPNTLGSAGPGAANHGDPGVVEAALVSDGYPATHHPDPPIVEAGYAVVVTESGPDSPSPPTGAANEAGPAGAQHASPPPTAIPDSIPPPGHDGVPTPPAPMPTTAVDSGIDHHPDGSEPSDEQHHQRRKPSPRPTGPTSRTLPSPIPLARRVSPQPVVRDLRPVEEPVEQNEPSELPSPPTGESAQPPGPSNDALNGPLRTPLLDPLLDPTTSEDARPDAHRQRPEPAKGMPGPNGADSWVSGPLPPVAPDLAPEAPEPVGPNHHVIWAEPNSAPAPSPASENGAHPVTRDGRADAFSELTSTERELLAMLHRELAEREAHSRYGRSPNGTYLSDSDRSTSHGPDTPPDSTG